VVIGGVATIKHRVVGAAASAAVTTVSLLMQKMINSIFKRKLPNKPDPVKVEDDLAHEIARLGNAMQAILGLEYVY